LYRFLALNPFIKRRHCNFLQAKKQGRARERDWETLGERETHTDTDFLPYCDVITREKTISSVLQLTMNVQDCRNLELLASFSGGGRDLGSSA
jgi:hypothetical protein